MKFRLRFIIRDLLWLTLVAAVFVLWWLDHRRLSDIIADLKQPPAPLKPFLISPSLPAGTPSIGAKASPGGSQWLQPQGLTKDAEKTR